MCTNVRRHLLCPYEMGKNGHQKTSELKRIKSFERSVGGGKLHFQLETT